MTYIVYVCLSKDKIENIQESDSAIKKFTVSFIT